MIPYSYNFFLNIYPLSYINSQYNLNFSSEINDLKMRNKELLECAYKLCKYLNGKLTENEMKIIMTKQIECSINSKKISVILKTLISNEMYESYGIIWVLFHRFFTKDFLTNDFFTDSDFIKKVISCVELNSTLSDCFDMVQKSFYTDLEFTDNIVKENVTEKNYLSLEKDRKYKLFLEKKNLTFLFSFSKYYLDMYCKESKNIFDTYINFYYIKRFLSQTKRENETIVINEGTLLYKGCNSRIFQKKYFFSFDPNIANIYTKKLGKIGNFNTIKELNNSIGRIEVYKVIKNIKLMNFSSSKAINSFEKYIRNNADPKKVDKILNAYFTGYTYSNRSSYDLFDDIVSKYICKSGLNGYIYDTDGKFHSEVLLCDYKNYLEKIDEIHLEKENSNIILLKCDKYMTKNYDKIGNISEKSFVKYLD